MFIGVVTGFVSCGFMNPGLPIERGQEIGVPGRGPLARGVSVLGAVLEWGVARLSRKSNVNQSPKIYAMLKSTKTSPQAAPRMAMLCSDSYQHGFQSVLSEPHNPEPVRGRGMARIPAQDPCQFDGKV